MPSPWRKSFKEGEEKSLPGEVPPPPRDFLTRGQVLYRGETYLRVVKVEGKRALCQTRRGAVGRFSSDARHFDVAQLLRLYRAV